MERFHFKENLQFLEKTEIEEETSQVLQSKNPTHKKPWVLLHSLLLNKQKPSKTPPNNCIYGTGLLYKPQVRSRENEMDPLNKCFFREWSNLPITFVYR